MNRQEPGSRPLAPPDRETFDERAGESERNPASTDELQALAWAAFTHDLNDLLQTAAGKWVAYRGRERVCLGDSQSAVYQECRRRGLSPEVLLVEMVYPAAAEEPTVFMPPLPDFSEDEA